VLVRIALVHDDRKFRDRLTVALRKEGHEVGVFERPAKAQITDHDPSKIEIAITRIKGEFPAIQIMVTRVPTSEYYTGGRSAILAEPLTADDVVKGLRSLLPVSRK